MDSVRISNEITVLKERALFLPNEGLLAVADLHLGFEGVLQQQGVSIPRRQKAIMLGMFSRMLDRFSPETVLVDGDLKHNFSRNLDDEWVEVKDVLRFLMERGRLIVVRGNHDNYLSTILGDLGIELRKSYRAGRYTFTHGHLDVKTKGVVVIGHEHPAIKLRDAIGATISLPAFVISSDVVILPAMSPLAIGVDVSSGPYLSPILKTKGIRGARVIGMDDKEGLLDFGSADKLEGRDASLVMR